MTGIFRANNPLNASILFVYGLLLKIPWFLEFFHVSDTSTVGFLYKALMKLLTPAFQSWPVLVPALVYLLLFTQALTLNFLINKRRMITKPNYLPAMSYLLITSFFPVWNQLTAPLIVNTLLLWVWSRLTNLGSGSSVKSTLFNVGFVIGICSLLYLPSFAFVLFVILSLIISRQPKITEWIMVVFGVITVWYFLFSILFITNDLYSFAIHGIAFEGWQIRWNVQQVVGMAIIGFMFLLGAYFVQEQSSKQIIQVRKRWAFVLINVLVLMIIPFLKNQEAFSDWIIVALPLAAFIGFGFYYLSVKWLRLLLHWSMVAFVLYYQYY